jgi:hypothetical protein
MKTLLTAASVLICALATVSQSSAQTALFSYNDGNGVPNAGTVVAGSSFTFSINLAFTAGGSVTNLEGASYWFEQSTPGAPFNFSITNRDVTGSPFTDLQTPGLSYPQTMSPQSNSDLGALLPTNVGLGNGSYFVANITVAVSSTAAYGTYVIEDTTTGGRTSVITDSAGHTFAIPQAIYTITVVPEPSTWVAAGLVAATLLLAQRRRLIPLVGSVFGRKSL